MSKQEDTVLQLLDGLTIKEKKQEVDEESRRLQHLLDRSGFRIFEAVQDKGFFSWNPPHKVTYQTLAFMKSVDELNLKYIDLKGKPNELVNIKSIRTPISFLNYLAPHETQNKFPHGSIDIICLHVAARYRKVDFTKIDFAFGGSTLEMLANNDNSEPFVATVIPKQGTKVILIIKRKDYVMNTSDVGFQFERLVTGQRMDDMPSISTSVEHLHIMNVSSYRVFFRAETDAVDPKNGAPIEIKSSNPRYWGTKTMFQMISSGSTKLCHGRKSRGALTEVDLTSLDEVSRSALCLSNTDRLEKNIVKNMKALSELLAKEEPGDVFKVFFDRDGNLELIPSKSRSAAVLPPRDIVEELMTP